MRRILGVFYVQNWKIEENENINVLKGKEEWNILRKRKIKSDDPFSYNPLKYQASITLWTVLIGVFQ